ncbi:ATP-binding protein [Salinisphaera sp. SPP-AMP-43]|uniref:ATP-binding protein n=1 Tax=Salinisphaera sp. SPP-AMP-43 TaxID=3121288 RepID=UPI003C6E00DC
MTPSSQARPFVGRPQRRGISLAALTACLVFAMILSSLVLAWFLFSSQLWRTVEHVQGERVEDLAQTVANMPIVVDTLASAHGYDPKAAIQHRIDGLRQQIGVDFIVVMDEQAHRLTHPDIARIGHHFRGDDEGPALAGQHYVSVAEGTLGQSVRGFAPVRDAAGRVVGAVSVGVTQSRLAPLRGDSRLRLLAWLGLVVVLGGGGAAWLATRVKRRLMGMEPDDIAHLVAEHRAVLDAMHEGVIVLDGERRVRLINPAARRLFEATAAQGPNIGQIMADPRRDAGRLGQGVDMDLDIGGRRFVGTVRSMPASPSAGTVITFRDSRELQRLGEELTGVRRYAQALRATTHDFKNKLHVILGLTQHGDWARLSSYVRELVDLREAATASLVERIAEPILAGFLIGKQNEAREQAIDLRVTAETAIPPAAADYDVHGLVSILGNVLDNAFEATAGCAEPTVALTLALEADTLSIAVQDNGYGMDRDQLACVREAGVSSKGEQRGLGLHLVDARLAAVDGTLAIYSEPGQGTLVEIACGYQSAT